MKPIQILLLLSCLAGRAELPDVIINEVMYNPPGDRDELQYLELFNRRAAPVDLSGWSFKRGAKYVFPVGSSIPPGGFLILSRDKAAFAEVYPGATNVLGNFTGRLSHNGENLELADKDGTLVERLRYSDKPPWPAGADGYSGSLERICPEGPADDPANWASSKPGVRKAPAGTPGAPNESYSAVLLPSVKDVKWPVFPEADQPLGVSAVIQGAEKVVLEYRLIQTGMAASSAEIAMERGAGGEYAALIPLVPEGSLVRFCIKAAGADGGLRINPSPHEPRPAHSAYILPRGQPGAIPLVAILNPEPIPGNSRKFGPPRDDVSQPGSSALIYRPPKGEAQLLDFVEVRRRAGGWKVHFLKDQLLEGMSAINLIFEGHSRWVLAEHLSYELFRRAGVLTPNSGHCRLTVDGRPLGYHLLVEQPNKTLLARSGRNEDGDLYKVIWYEQGIARQHEKKTNAKTGHRDITTLIETLRRKSGEDQWAFINEHFKVDAMVNYYAVNMCIQNWDGFFNNHFVFHDTKPGGKWEVIPWDEDKTWGEFDGASSAYDWYEMPLTIGMNGSTSRRGRFRFNNGPFGGEGWWRPPGWFSGPLLANPEFRKRFETRLAEICATIFTEEKFGPVIQSLRHRLRAEAGERAKSRGENPEAALKRFDSDIESFHRQLENRRKFILRELQKR